MQVKFGTSGWRAIIADDFTFEGVRIVTRAICRHLRAENAKGDGFLIVGHDTRFLGEQFAAVCVAELAAHGFKAMLCDRPTPTPTVSFAIRSQGALGGINFTASHNPPEYNGMKFSTADGAPALPEVTKNVERLIAEIQAESGATSPTAATPANAAQGAQSYDPCPAYLAELETKINFAVITRAGGAYAYDPLWGTGRGYLDAALKNHGLQVETVHDWRDVLFGGHAPEPDDEHLGELRAAMKRNNCVLGLATDGDGDRFGVLDADGTFIVPNQLIALLTDYLAESRGWTGGVARSVATSHLVDRVAQARGLELHETPVGFKFIGELINQDKILLGGEESAGLSMRGHIPEKDGILACLLAAEAVAARGASLGAQLEELYKRVGRLYTQRIGVRLTPEIMSKLQDKLRQEPENIGGRRVAAINRADGMKLLFDGGAWLLLRPSGTEPLVRIYAEAEDETELGEIINDGKKFLFD